MTALRLVLAGVWLPALAGAAVAQAPAPRFDGTWDLIWQTRRGPQQRGYLVLSRRGALLEGEIHGQGSVRARGRISGAGFVLRGSRMLVPYTIEGNVRGDRLEGSLNMLSVHRRFTGVRRP